jgi:hypothetical protein
VASTESSAEALGLPVSDCAAALDVDEDATAFDHDAVHFFVGS